jgi:zinc protease
MTILQRIIFLVSLGLLPLCAAPIHKAKHFVLSNGLQVVVITNHRSPVVAHELWVKAGTKDDFPGKSGLAHFLEHMFLKGTGGGVPEDKLMAFFDRLGASHNASTSWDYTRFYQHVPRVNLEHVMQIIAGRVRGLSFSEAAVTSERKVIIEERQMRTDNSPENQLFEGVLASLFWNHQYGIPLVGWKHEMQTLRHDDLMRFYNQFYQTNNMILFLAGDITLADAKRLAEKHYGRLKAGAPITHHARVEPNRHQIATHLTKRHERIAKRQFIMALPLVHHQDTLLSLKDMLALDVLEILIANDPLGYLHQDFVVKQKLATHVGLSFMNPMRHQPFAFVFVVPDTQHPTDSIRASLKSFFDALPMRITDQDVRDAKDRIRKSQLMASDHSFFGTDALGHYMVRGHSFTEANAWFEVFMNVTADDVRSMAARVTQHPYAVTAEALPTQRSKNGTATARSFGANQFTLSAQPAGLPWTKHVRKDP